MNRFLLIFTILASPMVAASWMLSPRFYNSLFGPSLLDRMLMTPTITTSSSLATPPSLTTTTSPSSLLRTLIDESNQLQQQMMSSMSQLSPTYEYMNHDTNVTIRMKIPSNMNIDNINVQYDEPNQLLWIRGTESTTTTTTTSNDEKNTNEHQSKDNTASTTTESAMVNKPTSMKSSSHYEFTQTFALNPKIVNVNQFTAQYENDMLVIVVPKYEIVQEEENHKVRTIPIMKSANPNQNHHTNGDAKTVDTTMAKNTEPVMAQ